MLTGTSVIPSSPPWKSRRCAITATTRICSSWGRTRSSSSRNATMSCTVRSFPLLHSCGECVKKYIENNIHFLCPKCNKVVRQQDLLKETKEVHEMKKIRDARKEVYSALNAMLPDYSSEQAKQFNLMRENYGLCIGFWLICSDSSDQRRARGDQEDGIQIPGDKWQAVCRVCRKTSTCGFTPLT